MLDYHEIGINVKDRSAGIPTPYISEDRLEAIFHHYAEIFWESADCIAQQHGYDGVWTEGRSGGWLVAHKDGRECPASDEFRASIHDLQERLTGCYEAHLREDNADETHLVRGEH
jgi:hypothetical protein